MRAFSRVMQGAFRQRRASVAVALMAVMAFAASCVSSGTHKKAVAERDALAREKGMLERRVEEQERRIQELDSKAATQSEELSQLRQAHAAELSQLRQARTTEVSQLRQTYDTLISKLESEVASGQVVIKQLEEGLSLNLTEQILFASGSAELGDRGREVLLTVSAELGKVPYQIVVGGHTDNVPIRGALASRYPTNWELAGARAARVVRLLEEAGIESNRLHAVSFGKNDPVASNDTPEGRAQNRRIEIRLRPVVTGESSSATPSSGGGQ